MSDTPRTDKESRSPQNAGRIGCGEIFDFARQLERELAAVTAERDALRADYDRACLLVAKMHYAATESYAGPQIGVVEDIEALKAERDALIANAMTEEKAREVLGATIEAGDLVCQRIQWFGRESSASLQGYFTALQLKAIAWWMENKGEAR